MKILPITRTRVIGRISSLTCSNTGHFALEEDGDVNDMRRLLTDHVLAEK